MKYPSLLRKTLLVLPPTKLPLFVSNLTMRAEGKRAENVVVAVVGVKDTVKGSTVEL